jgi:hypothetical protein
VRAVLLALTGMLGCLLFVAGIEAGTGDRVVLTPPPEAVAENFVRKLVTERFDVAREQLSDEARAKLSAAALEAASRGLKARLGEIEDVLGERAELQGDRAEAEVILTDARGRRHRVRLPLKWGGGWEVAGLGELTAARER